MKIVRLIKRYYNSVMVAILCLSASGISAADGIIPISQDDQTSSGSDIFHTFMNILQKDLLPFVELGGAAAILFYALAGLWKGYKEYQDRKELDHLKTAIIASALLVVIGGALLYLLDKLRNYQFS